MLSELVIGHVVKGRPHVELGGLDRIVGVADTGVEPVLCCLVHPRQLVTGWPRDLHPPDLADLSGYVELPVGVDEVPVYRLKAVVPA